MHIIRHPQTYMTGTRVLMLKARHKDGIEAERQVLRISHTREQFGHRLAELSELSRPGERIYAPASPRLMRAAIRLFKERQLAADYDADPEAFYRNIEGRWCSCLMDPRVQDGKLWLIDCDSESDRERAETELAGHYDREMPPYVYASKSGTHIVVQPFNRAMLSATVRARMHENPLMLWGWS